jgi:DNA-binding transcriptional LysR family regulator
LTELLFSGNADLAIGFASGSPSLQSHVAFEELWTEDNAVIARRRHPRIEGSISRNQYINALHAAVFYRRLETGLIDSILKQDGAQRRLLVTLPDFGSVCHTVATSDLVATLPVRLVKRFASSLKLQVLRCPIRLPQFRSSMLWHQRTQSDPPHLWLRSSVRQASHQINMQSEN